MARCPLLVLIGLIAGTLGCAGRVAPAIPAPLACADSAAAAGAYADVTDSAHVTSQARMTVLHGKLSAPHGLYGVPGRVVLRLVVDTLGRIAPCSMRLVSATDQRFVPAAVAAVDGAEFTPAELNGHKVAVWKNQPIVFQGP